MKEHTFLIDLDNCLYSVKDQPELVAILEKRITAWLQNRVGKTPELAEAYKQKLYMQYGGAPVCFVETGLIRSQHELSQCINYINGFRVEYMKPDNSLKSFLSEFKQRKYVFTSSPRHYADQILKRLQIRNYFDGLIDIYATDLLFKNNPDTYTIVSDIIPAPLSECVFVDDGLENLRVAQSCGMGKCILIAHGESYNCEFPTINSLLELTNVM